ncbi:hypothetical protein PHYSODRAFT_340506 [Phytophthora sojae]|uniref:Uncharacterized protein n=1 Tax=Phytophthora sojae (strain P6497) TaxID=1094619 RepID=G5A9X9_PHYSP|nr:hypothetical protein PHYSODRAFT_340506 [Phytophthora sojae]EGZ07409.1 hypothetical protein PHYSODRAFT_340506 [Phytophthora sojae]|eukprot:XP_009536975.1 hypothetical protein PHYSODRAFT_340506 [Phytophthora sojae]
MPALEAKAVLEDEEKDGIGATTDIGLLMNGAKENGKEGTTIFTPNTVSRVEAVDDAMGMKTGIKLAKIASVRGRIWTHRGHQNGLANISEILASADEYAGEYSFGGRADALPAAPGLLVEGVGAISLPLVEAQAQKLISICEKSPFGHNMDTKLDESVRKSWQLAPDQVEITNPQWQPGLEELSEMIATRLGYKGLLVYGEGGHFLKHQDSEKEDGMIATLVIQPPSTHEGGDFIVFRHGEVEHRHDFGKSDGTAPFLCCTMQTRSMHWRKQKVFNNDKYFLSPRLDLLLQVADAVDKDDTEGKFAVLDAIAAKRVGWLKRAIGKLDRVGKIFTWKMPYAKHWERNFIEDFLRGPKKEITTKRRMNHHQDEAPFNVAISEEKGKLFLTITKTHGWFDGVPKRLDQCREELVHLNERYNGVAGGSSAQH